MKNKENRGAEFGSYTWSKNVGSMVGIGIAIVISVITMAILALLGKI